MEESTPLIEALVPFGLYLCYFFFIVALISAVGMPILNAIKNPVGLVKALAGVVGLVILFGVAYGLSGSDVSPNAVSAGVDAAGSKLIGAGLITFYVMLLGSTVLAVYSLVKDIVTG